jgi:hypothetical protein
MEYFVYLYKLCFVMNHNYCFTAVDFATVLGSSYVSLHHISTGARYLLFPPFVSPSIRSGLLQSPVDIC